MLTFINTPAMAMSLGLRTFDEGLQQSRRARRTTERAPGRATRSSDTTVKVTGRRFRWLVRSLRPAH
jgi:hypothetical protein